ncbi:MAG TPA: pitrilysin family protein [Nitrospiria bacterium]
MRPKVFRTRLALAGILIFLLGPADTAGAETPRRTVMGNGIILLVQEAPSIPMVTVQVIVRAGSRRDFPGKAGLANLTAALLDEGTRTRTSGQIADALDFMGARFSVRAGSDYAEISLQVLEKDLEAGLEILSEMMILPAFPETELDRIRKEVKGGLIAEEDQPGTVAEKEFNRIIFGSHPYHLPVEGTVETIDAISQADIKTFHDRFYRPNNTILAMVGDISNKKAEKIVRRFFRKWTPGKVPEDPVPPIEDLKHPVTRLIDKDLTQANIVLGHPGINRSNPDYYAVSVMNYILGGGGFSSRLMKNIRDERGLVYGIFSYFDALEDRGSFSVAFQTQNSQAQTAIDEIMRELRAIRSQPVTPVELEEAKAFLMGSFPLRFDTTSKIANFLAQVEFHGLGLDYLERYPGLIQEVGINDIQRVAQKYIDPGRMGLVVVARQEEAKIGGAKGSPE